jgi:hypothetical protein
MKRAELRKLISEYNALKSKLSGKEFYSDKIPEKLQIIKHRYFHETGRDIEIDIRKNEKGNN